MKQNKPNWNTLVSESLKREVPLVDVRSGVRSALESRLEDVLPLNLFDMVAGLFEQRARRWALYSFMSAAAIWAFCGLLFVSSDSEMGVQFEESVLLDDGASFREDWTEFL